VDHPRDYATLNSDQLRDGTRQILFTLSFVRKMNDVSFEDKRRFSGSYLVTNWWASPLLWFVLSIAATIPFWTVRIAPLTDLPNHIARYFIFLNVDRIPFLANYYGVHWHLIGNLGVDVLVRLIGPTFGAEASATVVVALIPALTIGGIYAVTRALNGQITPSALIAIPLVYNWPFISGFVNFSLAAAMALLVFAAWIRLRKLSFFARFLIFVPLSFATWVAHVAGWGLLGLAVLGFELTKVHPKRFLNLNWLIAALNTMPFARAGPGNLHRTISGISA
jgi:hypothetical protein